MLRPCRKPRDLPHARVTAPLHGRLTLPRQAMWAAERVRQRLVETSLDEELRRGTRRVVRAARGGRIVTPQGAKAA
jgi:hypothetical protein